MVTNIMTVWVTLSFRYVIRWLSYATMICPKQAFLRLICLCIVYSITKPPSIALIVLTLLHLSQPWVVNKEASDSPDNVEKYNVVLHLSHIGRK